MRWCIYALGGGLGHLVRSLGLARAAIARGHHVTLLANTAYAPLLPVQAELDASEGAPKLTRSVSEGDSTRDLQAPSLTLRVSKPVLKLSLGEFITIPASFDRGQVTEFVHQTLRNQSFDALIVDTFPRGLAGELAELLPSLPGKKVLVHRDLNPHYVEQADLALFVEHYDLLISPGELGPLANRKQVHVTAPWLIRDFDELLDQHSAWKKLRIERTDLPVIAVIAAGFPAEAQAMQTLAERLAHETRDRANIRLITLNQSTELRNPLAINLWPTLSAIRGINLLIGAGGYNTVWEARSTQTPLIAINRPRLYDRQETRLTDIERTPDESSAFARAMSWHEAHKNIPRAEVPAYENGTHDAVRNIE